MPPSITKSAPAPNALATSPGTVQPPSLIICPPKPCAASAHSIIPLNCGIPTPVIMRVVHTEPGPIPHLTRSAPAIHNCSVISPVITFPAITIFSG